MKILSAVANGKNLLVLLAFALIGYSLVITPPFDTFSDRPWGTVGKASMAFGWNFIAAALTVWTCRLIVSKRYKGTDKLAKITLIPYAAIACGIAAVAGVLFS
jgi:hypothetical protein